MPNKLRTANRRVETDPADFNALLGFVHRLLDEFGKDGLHHEGMPRQGDAQVRHEYSLVIENADGDRAVAVEVVSLQAGVAGGYPSQFIDEESVAEAKGLQEDPTAAHPG